MEAKKRDAAANKAKKNIVEPIVILGRPLLAFASE